MSCIRMLFFNIGLQWISVLKPNESQLFQNAVNQKCSDFITVENPESGTKYTNDEEILLENTIDNDNE